MYFFELNLQLKFKNAQNLVTYIEFYVPCSIKIFPRFCFCSSVLLNNVPLTCKGLNEVPCIYNTSLVLVYPLVIKAINYVNCAN